MQMTCGQPEMNALAAIVFALRGLDREGELAALLEDEKGEHHRLPLSNIIKANIELEP